MEQVVAARSQMGSSLAFHIVFAALGIGLPLLVLIAEALWLRTGRRAYYDLARTWSRGMAVLFAVGAVSGTILSFELGLLWPTFMRYAGPIIGIPFSCEGFAFFVEGIFIALYLYGWDRLSPLAHWLCAIPVAAGGLASACFVIMVNAWMNAPAGFRLVGGRIVDVHPFVGMFSKPWLDEVIHGSLAAYVFTAFACAAVCAYALWRRDPSRSAEQAAAGLRIAIVLGMIAIPLQILAGDTIARFDADNEPAKFAALEALYHTEAYAPVTIGGLAGPTGVRYGIEIPGLLSVLAHFDPRAVVTGLDRVAPADRPPVALVHPSFDLMVGTGSLLLLLALVWLVVLVRRAPWSRPLLLATAIGAPLALVALEAGWCTTEFGRQPWIAVGVLRTSEAATVAPAIATWLFTFSGIYVLLAATCGWLLRRVGRAPTPQEVNPA